MSDYSDTEPFGASFITVDDPYTTRHNSNLSPFSSLSPQDTYTLNSNNDDVVYPNTIGSIATSVNHLGSNLQQNNAGTIPQHQDTKYSILPTSNTSINTLSGHTSSNPTIKTTTLPHYKTLNNDGYFIDHTNILNDAGGGGGGGGFVDRVTLGDIRDTSLDANSNTHTLKTYNNNANKSGSFSSTESYPTYNTNPQHDRVKRRNINKNNNSLNTDNSDKISFLQRDTRQNLYSDRNTSIPMRRFNKTIQRGNAKPTMGHKTTFLNTNTTTPITTGTTMYRTTPHNPNDNNSEIDHSNRRITHHNLIVIILILSAILILGLLMILNATYQTRNGKKRSNDEDRNDTGGGGDSNDRNNNNNNSNSSNHNRNTDDNDNNNRDKNDNNNNGDENDNNNNNNNRDKNKRGDRHRDNDKNNKSNRDREHRSDDKSKHRRPKRDRTRRNRLDDFDYSRDIYDDIYLDNSQSFFDDSDGDDGFYSNYDDDLYSDYDDDHLMQRKARRGERKNQLHSTGKQRSSRGQNKIEIVKDPSNPNNIRVYHYQNGSGRVKNKTKPNQRDISNAMYYLKQLDDKEEKDKGSFGVNGNNNAMFMNQYALQQQEQQRQYLLQQQQQAKLLEQRRGEMYLEYLKNQQLYQQQIQQQAQQQQAQQQMQAQQQQQMQQQAQLQQAHQQMQQQTPNTRPTQYVQ